MTNKNNSIAVLVSLALVVFLGLFVLEIIPPYQRASVATSIKPISVGFIGPLTGNGAAWGVEQQHAMQIAIEEINALGGLHGQLLQAIFEDGKCNGKDAVNAAEKLIHINNVRFIVTSCSSETVAIAPVTEKNKVLLLAAYATDAKVTYAGDYVFRVSYTDAITAKIIAAWINRHKKIALITEKTEYPVQLAHNLKESLPTISVVEEEYPHNSVDMRSQIAKLLHQTPEVIFVNPDSPATGIAVLKQLKEQKYTGPIFGNFFGSSSEVLALPAAQNMIFFADPTVEESPRKKHLMESFAARYGEKPDFEFAASAAYDTVYILSQAITAVGEDATAIKNYLYQLRDFQGTLGTYGFDHNGDMTGALPAAKQIIDGKIVDVQD